MCGGNREICDIVTRLIASRATPPAPTRTFIFSMLLLRATTALHISSSAASSRKSLPRELPPRDQASFYSGVPAATVPAAAATMAATAALNLAAAAAATFAAAAVTVQAAALAPCLRGMSSNPSNAATAHGTARDAFASATAALQRFRHPRQADLPASAHTWPRWGCAVARAASPVRFLLLQPLSFLSPLILLLFLCSRTEGP